MGEIAIQIATRSLLNNKIATENEIDSDLNSDLDSDLSETLAGEETHDDEIGKIAKIAISSSSSAVERIQQPPTTIPTKAPLKVGDIVVYIGANKSLKRQYKGILKIHSLSFDGACCYKEDRSLTGWIGLDELQ